MTDELMNTNPQAWFEYDKLVQMIKSGENIVPGTEVAKLREWYVDNNVQKLRLTLSPEFNGTAEDLARAVNKTNTYLADPVNHLVSKIEGHIFLKQDTVNCLENGSIITADGFEKRVLTQDEERKVRRLKEDISLFQQAIDMIKELNAK